MTEELGTLPLIAHGVTLWVMPADASLLADLDPFALLDVECGRVDRFWSVLPASGWARPTRCSTESERLSAVLAVQAASARKQ